MLLHDLPTELELDTFQWLQRTDIDSCLMTTRKWKRFLDAHSGELAVHHFKTLELLLDHHEAMRLERDPSSKNYAQVSLKDLKCREACLKRLKDIDLSPYRAVCSEYDGEDDGDHVNLRLVYHNSKNQPVAVSFRCKSVLNAEDGNGLEVLHWFSHATTAVYDEITLHRMVHLDMWEAAMGPGSLIRCNVFCFSGSVSTVERLTRTRRFVRERVRAARFDWYVWGLWDMETDTEETDDLFLELLFNSTDSVREQLMVVGWAISENVMDRLIEKFLTEDVQLVPRILVDIPYYNGHTVPVPAKCDDAARVQTFPHRITSRKKLSKRRACYSFRNANTGRQLDVVVGSKREGGTPVIESFELYLS